MRLIFPFNSSESKQFSANTAALPLESRIYSQLVTFHDVSQFRSYFQAEVGSGLSYNVHADGIEGHVEGDSLGQALGGLLLGEESLQQ